MAQGGAGFNTNGETFYSPPVMMERYMEAARQILDRAIITPALSATNARQSRAIKELAVDPG
ncbi:MAG TPA: DUF1587 domain-containing protein [Bryobacteraceae bacterium]|nr:DUF1587 domain-containing protein [Bryobacteraceae bacterium]